MTTDVAGASGGAVDSKGLKGGALGLMAATIVGVASTAPGYSIAASLGFVNDRPAEAILRAAEQFDALTIVVGAAGRGPMAGALLGSVTYQVVHRSTRPVLVVPAPEAD